MSWRRRRNLLRTLAILCALVAVLASAGLVSGYRYADRLVAKGKRKVANLTPVASGQAMNILLVGSDSRTGLTRRQLGRIQTVKVPGRRTDTIMVLHVSPRRDKAVMVSLPRDLRTTIDGTPARSTPPSPSAAPGCWSGRSRRRPGCPSTTTPRSTSPAS